MHYLHPYTVLFAYSKNISLSPLLLVLDSFHFFLFLFKHFTSPNEIVTRLLLYSFLLISCVLFIICRSLKFSQKTMPYETNMAIIYSGEDHNRFLDVLVLNFFFNFSNYIWVDPHALNADAKLRKTDFILIRTIIIIVNIYSKNHSFLIILTCVRG